MKKVAPETPKAREAKPSSSVDPLMDTQAQITDLSYS